MGYVWSIIWGMSGASSGACLGITWGMSGASFGTCLGHHLGHVWGTIWAMSWASSGTGVLLHCALNMKSHPKWPFCRTKKHFSCGQKVGHVGQKHAPGTPGIPKKFQVFTGKFHIHIFILRQNVCAGACLGQSKISAVLPTSLMPLLDNVIALQN